jgi:hypothetical protein
MGCFEAEPWGAVVLTLPSECWDAAGDPRVLAELCKRAVAVVERWARAWLFHGVPVRLGGFVASHPCGDDPRRWQPHVNVVFGIVGLTDHGAPRRGRWLIPRNEFQGRARAALEHLWRAELVDLGWTPGPYTIQVHYRPRVFPAQRLHAARYYGRTFPHWAAWTHRIRYWGLVREKWQPEGCEPEPRPSEKRTPHVCTKCGEHTTATLHVVPGKAERWIDDAWQACRAPPFGPLAELYAGEAVTDWPPDRRRPAGARGAAGVGGEEHDR